MESTAGQKRKVEDGGDEPQEKVSRQEDGDDELERLAIERLLSEAKQNKARAERNGVCGWYDALRPRTNKTFAKAVVRSTVIKNSRLKKN